MNPTYLALMAIGSALLLVQKGQWRLRVRLIRA